MNFEDKKFIIFVNDENKNEALGEKHYVKFLNDDRSQAFFYRPLIAPRNIREIIRNNEILEAYEITDEKVLEQYANEVYTFIKRGGIYDVYKGVLESVKYVYLVGEWMDPQLDLPRFLYEIQGSKIILTSGRLGANKENFCYVVDEENLNPALEPYMIKVTEQIPGHLQTSPSTNPPCKKFKPSGKNKGQ